jgi:hypothetical protein
VLAPSGFTLNSAILASDDFLRTNLAAVDVSEIDTDHLLTITILDVGFSAPPFGLSFSSSHSNIRVNLPISLGKVVPESSLASTSASTLTLTDSQALTRMSLKESDHERSEVQVANLTSATELFILSTYR